MPYRAVPGSLGRSDWSPSANPLQSVDSLTDICTLGSRQALFICRDQKSLRVSPLGLSCPDSATRSLLTTLPVRGPYSWDFFFFKLWKLKLIFFKGIFYFLKVDFGDRIFLFYFIFSFLLPLHVTNQRSGEVSLCFPLICEIALSESLCKNESMSCKSACMHNEQLSWFAVPYN